MNVAPCRYLCLGSNWHRHLRLGQDSPQGAGSLGREGKGMEQLEAPGGTRAAEAGRSPVPVRRGWLEPAGGAGPQQPRSSHPQEASGKSQT